MLKLEKKPIRELVTLRRQITNFTDKSVATQTVLQERMESMIPKLREHNVANQIAAIGFLDRMVAAQGQSPQATETRKLAVHQTKFNDWKIGWALGEKQFDDYIEACQRARETCREKLWFDNASGEFIWDRPYVHPRLRRNFLSCYH